MPPPLNAKVNESALAVCVLVRVPATTSKAGKIQRDRAFAGIALPDVRHAPIDDGVFSQNEFFTCFSLKLLRMIDRGLNNLERTPRVPQSNPVTSKSCGAGTHPSHQSVITCNAIRHLLNEASGVPSRSTQSA